MMLSCSEQKKTEDKTKSKTFYLIFLMKGNDFFNNNFLTQKLGSYYRLYA